METSRQQTGVTFVHYLFQNAYSDKNRAGSDIAAVCRVHDSATKSRRYGPSTESRSGSAGRAHFTGHASDTILPPIGIHAGNRNPSQNLPAARKSCWLEFGSTHFWQRQLTRWIEEAFRIFTSGRWLSAQYQQFLPRSGSREEACDAIAELIFSAP